MDFHRDLFHILVWKNQADFVIWSQEQAELHEKLFHPEDIGSEEGDYNFWPLFVHEDEERVIAGIEVENAVDSGPNATVIGLWLKDDDPTDGCQVYPELLSVWGECDTLTGIIFDQGYFDFTNLDYYARFHQEYYETSGSERG